MKVKMKIPTCLWDDSKDDYQFKLSNVIWDSDKGELTGDKVAIWYLEQCVKLALDAKISFGLMPSETRITNPLTKIEDMVAVLRYSGLNVPDELLEYDVSWFHSASQLFDDYQFYSANPTKEEIKSYEESKLLIVY